MGSLELLINLTIIGLLIPTIVYAYRLNKNLNILRQNQNSLAKLVDALNDATFKAENSIPKLKSVTEHSSNDLKEVVENAKELKDDLMFINQRADNLADRLEGVISDTRTTLLIKKFCMQNIAELDVIEYRDAEKLKNFYLGIIIGIDRKSVV